MLEDEQGNICNNQKEIEKECVNYVQELYKDDERKPTIKIAELAM